MAGNISPAALEKLSTVLNQAKSVSELPQIWVLELSSFQLHFTHTLNPTAATVLNLSQDHLDWHGDMKSYAAAKARILGSDSVLVLNRDDLLVSEIFILYIINIVIVLNVIEHTIYHLEKNKFLPQKDGKKHLLVEN